MAFEFQRIRDRKLAFSSRKQTANGTALADALLDELVRQTDTAARAITKEFRSDLDQIKGDEFASDLQERRRDLRLTLAADLNSWLAAFAAVFCLGKVTTSQPDVANDPNAYEHIIIPTTPPGDSVLLPVTTLSQQISADINEKLVDMVVRSMTLSGANNSAALGLSIEMIGSGIIAAGVASYPALPSPEIGLLFNSDMVISLGPEGSPVDISERIQDWSVTLTNNFDENLSYFPGSGLFRGRFPHGDRRLNASLGVFIKDVDDIKTLFDGTDKKELKFKVEGQLTTGGVAIKHSLELRLPAIRMTGLEPADDSGFGLWRIEIGPEGVMRGASLTEPFQFKIINEEATFLATV